MMNQKGQSLIEILIAFGVAAIILSAITYSVINSLKNAQYAKNQTLATQYSQEGMDIVRNIRYTDYGTFNSLPSASYCLADTCTSLSTLPGNPCGPVGSQCSNTPNVAGIFIRQVSLQSISANCSNGSSGNGTLVNAAVSWTDGQCTGGTYCHTVSTTNCITNYDIVPTP